MTDINDKFNKVIEAYESRTGHRLKGRGDQREGPCPCSFNHSHGDRNASFSIGIMDGRDKIGMHCHVGCENDAIRRELQLEWSDFFANSHERKPSGIPKFKPRTVTNDDGPPPQGISLAQYAEWKSSTRNF